MGEKTQKDLYDGFTGESKAAVRLKAFARKAEDEDYPGVARLFRAIAESESVHAYNNLRLLGVINDTEANLEESLSREEKIAQVSYDGFIADAESEDDKAAATMFGYARDVEERHAKLYEGALQHMVADEVPNYYVCSVCGYVADGVIPEKCPICGAPETAFSEVK
ncbi:MAG: rubrerythrin [Candidatus Solincola sediminis]|uniref:Rubrerythrin n=1 Tax=Candidatus Solincola sediminis TaxID=1797199 RepID=A0A1F2WQW1_9ACTN|nr:MAG: rubrerythrin [Candidatus Solincola sediminis]OFW59229.1 MAG: rubrerythrin [Candidatus Solincola sediminis]